MVLKFQCPECGKGEKSELIELLPERRYRMKCGDCECTYILTTSSDEERKCDKPGKAREGMDKLDNRERQGGGDTAFHKQ